ncbi:MAG: hypothetical protein H7A37_08825 [Chlamydiales bacterium]|nr:hypothetical protein [Chlamydiia bacterium]MCP5508383.1 hypothetical protein [Chlamydiales bacterium]
MMIDEEINQLETFSLEGDYLARLRQLTDHILLSPEKARALDPMLALLARYPNEDFGAPGPLVHAIEKCSDYERALFEYVEKSPTTTFVWMLRRLFNRSSDKAIRDRCKFLLEKIAGNQDVDDQIREDATICLQWLDDAR